MVKQTPVQEIIHCINTLLISNYGQKFSEDKIDAYKNILEMCEGKLIYEKIVIQQSQEDAIVYTLENMFNGKLSGLTPIEIIEKMNNEFK